MYMCCEMKSDVVPDLMGELKQAALVEVMKKRVIRNIAILLRCVNPYAVANVIIIKERNTYKVYNCGDLVFFMVQNDLKKYICGDWTDALSDEANAIRTQRSRAKIQDATQSVLNKFAAQNYVVCRYRE